MALPRVIAGPVVRRVERTTCSFWVVLREPATVTAKIWKGHQAAPVADSVPLVATGELATRAIGLNLHVAVVTVDTSGTPLAAGELYSYDLQFKVGSTTTTLKDEKLLEDEGPTSRITDVDPMAPLHLALGFEKDRLPSFLAPPATFAPTTPPTAAAGLRLAHASCRRPGSGAIDALGGLASLVEDDDTRPHQLHLTGDQIYADDVTTAFFTLVTALASDLAGAQSLPGFPPDPRTGGSGPTPVTGAGVAGSVANLPAMRRQWLLWQLAGFTGGDAANHLITFPEFVAHHLLAWSPRAWRAIPTFEQSFVTTPEPDPAIAPWLNKPWFCGDGVDVTQPETLPQQWADKATNVAGFEGFNRGARQVARYAAATPAVAQVLANTPTYMIFDDHEIADDWNLNGRWVSRVYNREWGRFVVRNGLLAYALMQGWGNDPAHFTKDGEPGRKLLDAIPAAVQPGTAPTATVTADLDVLLGFDAPTTALPKRVRWNFSIKATDHSVVVLDTRTHRDVNDLSLEAPNLVTNLDEQVPEKSATDTTTQLLVVVSPVPVFGPSVIEQLGQPLAQLIIDLKHDHHVGEVPGFRPGDANDPRLAAGCGGRVERGGEKYDREGWSANDAGFEALLARLAGYPAVVLLSGDVHYGCTMALDYWAKERERPTRIVQCTSSPAKNTFKAQIEEAVRQDGSLQRALEVPMELYGPGDVTGIDRRVVLRSDPTPGTTDFEPNYLVTIDFDPPDLPWMFTPARAVGDSFVHRYAVAIGPPALSAAWRALVAEDARSIAEPRVDSWVAHLLGEPSSWAFSARSVGTDGEAGPVEIVTLADLGLGPLALVAAAVTGAGEHASELEQRIARAVAGRRDAGTGVELLATTTERLGLAELMALAGAIARVLRTARPGDARTFDVPDSTTPAAVDVTELTARATAAEQRLRDATLALDAAIDGSTPTVGAVRDVIDGVSRAGVPGAVPPIGILHGPPGDAAPPEAIDAAAAASAAAHARLAQLDALGGNDAETSARRRIAVVFGETFPVLGLVDIPAGPAGIGDAAVQSTLTGDDPLAVATWLTHMSKVRPELDALWHLLVGAEATTGGFTATEHTVVQLPARDGARWAALPFESDHRSAGVAVATVVHTPGFARLEGSVAVLVIDSWTEQIPVAEETAGIALQYDAPSNRAPQVALLAVPPDVGADRPWSVDALLSVIGQSLDMAHGRGVTLDELPAAGSVLPALYAPFDIGDDVPSVDFDRLVNLHSASTLVMGKD